MSGEAHKLAVLSVRCRRLERPRTVRDHRSCPYCFGAEEAVESGEHRRFCSYEPGVDATCFGFPEGFSRDRDR